MNMVLKKQEAKLGVGLKEVIKQFLGINIEYVGSIPFDKIIRKSVTAEIPYIVNKPEARPSHDFFATIPQILGINSHEDEMMEMLEREIRRMSKTYGNRIVESHRRNVDPSIYLIDKVKTYEQSDETKTTGIFTFKTLNCLDPGSINFIFFSTPKYAS